MTLQNPITVAWLRGFFETDGSFMILFSSGNRKPVAKFSQKTNSNLLSLIQIFLKQKGITSQIKESNPETNLSGRAPDLLITGINNVANFVTLLKSENGSHTFVGQKQRDLFIIEEIISNDKLTKAQLIGLKKSLHKSNKSDPDFVGKNFIPRQELEMRCGVSPNESITATEPILQRIDETYVSHQNAIEKSMQNNTLSVKPDYIIGLIDGDGGFSVSFLLKNPKPNYNKNHVEWQHTLCFTMEKFSMLTIKVLLYTLGSDVKISVSGGLGGGLEVLIRAQKEISKLIEIHEQFPLLGNYRQQQYATVIMLRQFKAERKIKDYESICILVKEMYRVSSISRGGRKRMYASAEEAIEAIVNWTR